METDPDKLRERSDRLAYEMAVKLRDKFLSNNEEVPPFTLMWIKKYEQENPSAARKMGNNDKRGTR